MSQTINEIRSVIVQFRLTETEYKKIFETANELKITVSTLIRNMIFRKPIITKIDWNSVNELKRQGGLLKHFFNTTGGQNSKMTLKILTDIQALVKKIETNFTTENE